MGFPDADRRYLPVSLYGYAANSGTRRGDAAGGRLDRSHAGHIVEVLDGGIPAVSSSKFFETVPVTQVRRRIIKALQDAGVGLLLGTDAPAY